MSSGGMLGRRPSEIVESANRNMETEGSAVDSDTIMQGITESTPPKAPIEQDEERIQEFQLVNQDELNPMIGRELSLHLKYVTLFGTTLTIQDDMPALDPTNDTPRGGEKKEYIIQRKYGMVGEDRERLQFIIQVQDCAKKYRYTKLILGVP